MPVIFVTDAPTLWGSDYADIVGVQYEFPTRYRNLVAEGDRFLYYRGSRGAALGVGYFGEGVVGKIASGSRPDHLLAAVHDVTLYAEPVTIKDAVGNYRETGSTTGTNWANGVRRIDDERFNDIALAAAGQPAPPRLFPGFADPAHASKLERYSVAVVLKLLGDEFGAQLVNEMPPGNPGFDIEVLTNPPLHVEVKGTVLSPAVFHLSEGQRRHAELLKERFRLVVVHDVDLHRSTHKVAEAVGPLSDDKVQLKPEAYSGAIL